MTVGEYLDGWLKDYAKQHVAPQTYRRYESIVRLHIKPALGGVRLSQLQPAHIQRFYTRTLESGRIANGQSLSSTTVLQMHRVLSEALKHAFRLGLIAHNPAQATTAPRRVRHEVDTYDAAEVKALLAAAAGNRMHIPILLAVMTGMRRGEVLGLKWSDVVLDDGEEMGSLQVRRSLQETKDGISAKVPKTSSGSRTIALSSTTVAELKRHHARQAAQRLALGASYHGEDWVCAADDGKIISPSAFSHGFKNLVAAVGLRRIRLHDLRHTHATLLLLQGVNPKVVSERLGHSTVSLTLDVYSHVMPGMQQQAVDRFEELLADGALK